jgi:hypothetical protein
MTSRCTLPAAALSSSANGSDFDDFFFFDDCSGTPGDTPPSMQMQHRTKIRVSKVG